MSGKDKNKDEFYRKLVSLVFPIAFQQFMLSLVSASDAVIPSVRIYPLFKCQLGEDDFDKYPKEEWYSRGKIW